MEKNVFQFKIILRGIEPLIWRRIQILESCTFWDLNTAIQDSVGWKESHVHLFRVKNPDTKDKELIGIAEVAEDERILPGWELKVQDYLALPDNDYMLYSYDFGDRWEHFVEFEGVFPRQAAVNYPICLEGGRACPPENIGGTFEYERYLQMMSKPDHPLYLETLQSVGAFDPESFDVSKVTFWNSKARLDLALM